MLAILVLIWLIGAILSFSTLSVAYWYKCLSGTSGITAAQQGMPLEGWLRHTFNYGGVVFLIYAAIWPVGVPLAKAWVFPESSWRDITIGTWAWLIHDVPRLNWKRYLS